MSLKKFSNYLKYPPRAQNRRVADAGPIVLVVPMPPKRRGGLRIQEHQEEAILDWLRKHGYDPLNLPPYAPGLAGIKSVVLKAVAGVRYPGRDRLLFPPSKSTLDNTWQRLRKAERVRYANELATLKKRQ